MKLSDFMHACIDKAWKICAIATVSSLMVTLLFRFYRHNFAGSEPEYFIPLTIAFCASCPVSYIVGKIILIFRKTIEEKNQELTEYNESIMESVRYAGLIQRSILPTTKEMQENLPDGFVIWMPRDIIGGDIYQVYKVDSGYIFCVIDCTGHGIPGAMLSMLAASSLKRIIREEKCTDPSRILSRMNQIVKRTLNQDREESFSDDGMDASICLVEPSKKILTYAGAVQPVYYIKDGKLNFIKGDRTSIGYKGSDENFSFTNHRLDLEKGMSFYMLSDGYISQRGGERGRPMGKKALKKLIMEGSGESLEKHKEMFLHYFRDYMADYEQIDDVTLAGYKIVCE